jgi:sirohydrochlorin cobaltochelatase
MTHASPPTLGIVLFAHGSRDALWRVPIEAIATCIAQQAPHAQVGCAYLELCEPDLATVAKRMVHQGATHIRVLPIFFGMGKHAREDLPELVKQLQTEYPPINWELLPPAGEFPELTQLLANIALNSTSNVP